MAQITTGIRSILSSPAVYELVQTIMNAKKGRNYFVSYHLKPNAKDRILDIGCGPASLLPFLPQDVDYVGYDPSSTYIENAKQRFGDRGQFHAAIFTQAEADKHEPFDLIILSAVLHHMSDAEVIELFSLLRSVMKQTGRVVTVDPARVNGQHPVARGLINLDRGQHIRTPDAYRSLALKIFANVEGTVKHTAFIPYTHWFMHCRT